MEINKPFPSAGRWCLRLINLDRYPRKIQVFHGEAGMYLWIQQSHQETGDKKASTEAQHLKDLPLFEEEI